MKAFEIFLATFLLFKGTLSVQINCEFRLECEECKVNSMMVTSENDEVTGISGRRSINKTNANVKELWIVKDVESEFVPSKFCEIFSSLERLDIYGTKIKKLSGNVLKNCSKVWKICIFYTSLTTLPGNVFDDLAELKELFMYENKFVVLPGDLVSKNLKLTLFSVKSNQIVFFDIHFEDSVTSVDLRENKCFDKRFPEDYAEIKNISKFNDEVKKNCESPASRALTVKTDEILNLKSSLKDLETKIESLKSEKVKLEQQRIVMFRNISQITTENIVLSQEINARAEEIKEIKSNNVEKIKETFNKVIEFQAKSTKCQAKLLEKSNDFEKLTQIKVTMSANLQECQNKTESLSSNLTSTFETFKNLQNKIEFSQLEITNFNESLEKCQQNLTTVNDELATKVSSLIDIKAELLVNNSCGSKVDPIHVVFIALTFAVVLSVTIIVMRRHASRTLIRNMINQEVSLKGLLGDE
jgi:hypothetical protein